MEFRHPCCTKRPYFGLAVSIATFRKEQVHSYNIFCFMYFCNLQHFIVFLCVRQGWRDLLNWVSFDVNCLWIVHPGNVFHCHAYFLLVILGNHHMLIFCGSQKISKDRLMVPWLSYRDFWYCKFELLHDIWKLYELWASIRRWKCFLHPFGREISKCDFFFQKEKADRWCRKLCRFVWEGCDGIGTVCVAKTMTRKLN